MTRPMVRSHSVIRRISESTRYSGVIYNLQLSNNYSALHHTLHIKTDGALWTWGDNAWGQLGQNSVVLYSSPVQIGSDTNWTQTTIEWRASGGIKTIEG